MELHEILKKTWQAGFDAYHAGRPIEDGNKIDDAQQRKHWFYGWRDAEYEATDAPPED